MTPHLLRYQGLAVDDYGVALDASNLGHPQLSFIQMFKVFHYYDWQSPEFNLRVLNQPFGQ